MERWGPHQGPLSSSVTFIALLWFRWSMEKRHPDDDTPRVEDLFAAGVAEMKAAPEPVPAEAPAEATPPPTAEAQPGSYRGATQADAPDVMHVQGKAPKTPAPDVNLVTRTTVDLGDDDDIAW